MNYLTQMHVVCSWCDDVVRPGNTEHVTHGMCKRCQSLPLEQLDLQVEYIRARKAQQKDGCEVCHGEKGGVPGNGNVIAGRVVCDYCHADGSYLR
jgi:hypothetical protein